MGLPLSSLPHLHQGGGLCGLHPLSLYPSFLFHFRLCIFQIRSWPHLHQGGDPGLDEPLFLSILNHVATNAVLHAAQQGQHMAWQGRPHVLMLS